MTRVDIAYPHGLTQRYPAEVRMGDAVLGVVARTAAHGALELVDGRA
jgi:hypothetical protein